jgi:hypothetical protein
VSATPTTATEIADQILGLIGQQDPMGRGDDEEVVKALRACSRDQLVGFARQLGLTGVTKLAKDALAGRIGASLLAVRAVAAPAAGPETPMGSLPAKFDLGPGADVETDGSRLPPTIPWGYGADRVTAMAVNPSRLYVYWEVTDAAIEAARTQLGAGGAEAWLSLRVYDISGRLFDGTNAHSYFDERVGREVRQWFFEIGKPTSTTCVEIGMKSLEGYFVKIARSGRVDFSRDAPEPAGAVEWLTVRTATGYVGEPIAGGPPRPDGHMGVGVGTIPGASADDWQGWTDGAGFPVPGGATRDGGVEWRETGETHVHHELGRVEWVGPVHRTEWQAGPFAYPVEAPALSTTEHHETGEVATRTEDGIVHVVYGPWRVVIRGTGTRAERRVLATWEYQRTVELPGGVERYGDGHWEPVGPGASEWRLVGASERRWLGASELLGRGGSEVWLMGASERFFGGASERLYRGASERLLRGASERLLRGASERRLGGASERAVAGGFQGASERVTAGRLGASDNAPASSDDTLPYPRPES